jgi:plastocyanin
VLLVSCERAPFNRKALDVGDDTVQLAPGVVVHDVQIRANGSSEFEPVTTPAHPGDVIRFIDTDSRTHVIEFDEATLPGSALQLFKKKTQLRSPPLVVQGATWIISLADAPAGTYTFHCSAHGATGQLTVR